MEAFSDLEVEERIAEMISGGSRCIGRSQMSEIEVREKVYYNR